MCDFGWLTDQEAAGARVAHYIREEPHGAAEPRVAFARCAAGARGMAWWQHAARVQHAGNPQQQQVVYSARQKHLEWCDSRKCTHAHNSTS